MVLDVKVPRERQLSLKRWSLENATGMQGRGTIVLACGRPVCTCSTWGAAKYVGQGKP